MRIDYETILNNGIASSLGNIVSAIILGIFGLLFLDEKRVLAPWIYKFFNKKVARAILFTLRLLYHPYFRVFIILGLLFFINYRNVNAIDILSSFLISLLFLSFLLKSGDKLKFTAATQISDSFKNLTNWETKTGQPVIEPDFGKPAPDLGLRTFAGEATNSFVIIKDTEAERGVIECDIYLEENAVLNIVFFCNQDNDNWYMARFDSRATDSDGFLIKDEGHWRFFKMSGTQTKTKDWVRARIEFNSTKVSMYKDGILLIEISNPNIFGKKIGIFNEVANVHIDNFSFTEEEVQ